MFDKEFIINKILHYFKANKNTSFKKTSNTLVYVKKSTIQDSGYGLFVNKNIKRNDIITFYPGYYIPNPPLSSIDIINNELPKIIYPISKEYTIFCDENKGYIDAKNYISSYDALGHLINHPDKNIRANVKSYDFLWDDVNNNNNNYYNNYNTIPPKDGFPWYFDPNDNECKYFTSDNDKLLCGIVFIADRDINKDEELFYDYRYSSKETTPLWYHKSM